MTQKKPRAHKTGGKPETYTGVIMTTGKGLGFVNDENRPFAEDILIESGHLNTALNGDEVEFSVNIKRGSLRQTGEIIRVVSRAKTVFIGTIEAHNGQAVFSADDNRAYVDFRVAGNKLGSAKNNDKVQAKLLPWTDPKREPEVEIIRVLGAKGEHHVEMESIVLDKGFDMGFPPEVAEAAELIETNEKVISPEEIARRRDFRQTLTFTIDPVDAKDFDDAISFKKLDGGRFEIGVHIADVSHYVREGGILDREAFHRGSSIYLVDRTIPMLPEALSNDVCSLNPHEDKLTFSAVFVMDAKAQIHQRWFGRTIINSAHRFTYESAQEVLDTRAGEHFVELDTLNAIAKVLQAGRFKEGAIEFEQDEVKFKLDQDNKPIGVYRKERGDTHKLVEEYMLLANREVAKFIFDSIAKQPGAKKAAAIYRIHDLPDKEKIEALGILVRALGHYFPEAENITSKSLNAMLKSIEGTPEASLIKTATIRSMSKAVYSTKNVGHFGLAFPFYTHFTSPIRRYPDLLVHRILANHLTDKKFGTTDLAKLEHAAIHSTDREIAAAEAERASVKYKQVEYMSTHLGETFDGSITGVTEWGIYVEEVNTKCEGMIPLRSLDDFYELDKKTYSLIGQKSKKRFRLGDKIKFKVVRSDLERKTLDYSAVL
ncbi:MAG: ribonuclease R [Patescibacteria group bacterium]|nr:ribonuclease R [Patescibacteria group bacterium]MDE2172489.1 ribonuclease R [Patescibacteria group bacterium]